MLTGERTVPGIPHENYWFRRHEAAYLFLAPFMAARSVLEVGCGEGYGTDLLSGSAKRVVGIDYDALTVAHADETYPAAAFLRANLAALPVRSRSVDAVLSLQVIEHVWDHGGYLAECRRVLGPNGLLALTTPNRLTFSPGLDAPVNPFHTKEFTARELTDLVEACGFVVEFMLGLHAGPRLAGFDRSYGSFVDAQLAGPPAQWPARLLDDVVSVRSSDFPVHDRDVDASLDLVVLARRND
jgi:SAM-dependent methyltransferase